MTRAATILATVSSNGNGTHANAEQALTRHGFNGERLLKLARTVARDYCNTTGTRLGDRHEDLISALTEHGLGVALKYDPTRSGPNYTFASYMYDKLYLAVEPAFLRRKREGFGDRRYGNDGRLVLTEEFDTDVDTDFDFEKLMSERRLAQIQRAAETVGMTAEEFVVVTLDKASRQVLHTAA